LAVRREKALDRSRRPEERQRDATRPLGPGADLGLASLSASWVGATSAGAPPTGLLQTLQRTVGNQATTQLLQRQVTGGVALGAAVQRGKKKRKKTGAKKKSLVVDLKRKVNQTLKIAGLSLTAYNAFMGLLDRFDPESTLDELKKTQRRYFKLLNQHHLALNMVVAPHPAGAHIADHAGNLVPPFAGAARASFYPSGYSTAANNAWSNWCTAHTDPITNLVQCPGFGRAPHLVAQTAITIDHIVSVCTHWNSGHGVHPAGRNCTRAQRNTFFNDVTNHTYLCGPCNTSKGSGGNNYQQVVGPNFRN
jgi:hypothetical protein